jgi:hypothetical protein
MGQYANTVNAYAQDEANVRVYKTKRIYNSFGQTAYMLNVSSNKFRTDIAKKADKLVVKLQQQRVAELQQELAQLTA